MNAAKKKKWPIKIMCFEVRELTSTSLFVSGTLLFFLFAKEKSHVLKNAILRGTMRQTTFHD
jgi:hypothetical protein